MKQEINSINLVESNLYTGRPNKLVVTKFIVINPDNTYDGIEYANLRSVLNELMNTEVGDKLMEDYIDSIDHRFNEEEFSEYCFDHVEEVASDLNFRIMRVLK